MNRASGKRSPFAELRFGAAFCFCLIPALNFAQGIGAIDIVTPREFGYSIGDIIRHEMHLTLNEPISFDTRSLPESGRLNRWLEISRAYADVEHAGQSARYRITVEYQIFNAPPELTSVTVPQLEFLTIGGANPIPVFLPEWTFSIAPITDAQARQALVLRDDRHPQSIPLEGRRARLLLWIFLLGSLLAYLLYRHFILPRLRRHRYPFSNALRELHELRRQKFDEEKYQLGLRIFHSAMNATAGQVVFAGNLDDFLTANPQYAGLGPQLKALYARSREVFFDSSDSVAPRSALLDLVDICRHCRALERSVA